jgi:hypothetical protein
MAGGAGTAFGRCRSPRSTDMWLEPYREYWTGRFDALERHLEENPE